MIWLALFIAIAFLFIQIQLADYSELELLGKSIASGRDEMFSEYLSTIKSNPIDYVIGNLFSHQLRNYHNGPLSLIMNFGYIGYICYLVFWLSETRQLINRPNISSMQRLAIALLMIYFIHSASEAGPTLGTIPYGTQLVLTVRIAKDRFIK